MVDDDSRHAESIDDLPVNMIVGNGTYMLDEMEDESEGDVEMESVTIEAAKVRKLRSFQSWMPW